MSDGVPKKSPQPNRRPSARRKPRSDCKVECRKGTTGLGKNLAVAMLDVSQSGIRLVLKAPFAPGEEAEIILAGTGAKLLKRAAVAVWSLAAADGTHAAAFRFRQAMTFPELQQISRG